MASGIKAGDEVPIAPFRDAFLASGLSYSELARRMGWTLVKPDVQKVRRQLGLAGSQGLVYNDKPREFMHYDIAVKLAEALDIDPVEVGL
jgi:hypothetical protein